MSGKYLYSYSALMDCHPFTPEYHGPNLNVDVSLGPQYAVNGESGIECGPSTSRGLSTNKLNNNTSSITDSRCKVDRRLSESSNISSSSILTNNDGLGNYVCFK